MSLQLRKAAQQHLDTYGLSQYHARISDSTKNLVIVGECGKPLFIISGIQFGRNNPTIAEIEYATELLDAFLGTHAEKIQEFILANTVFNSLPIIEATLGDFKIGIQMSNWYCMWEHSDIETKLFMNGEMYTRTLPAKIVSTSVVQVYKVTAATKRDAMAYLTAYYEYKQKEFALDKLRNALSKCDI